MNIIDIILTIILVWALINGLRKGLISQACTVVGLLLGVWLAFKFNGSLSEWIGVQIEGVAAYALLFAAGVLLAWLCSLISGWILHGIGLGFVDKLGGALLSLIFYCLLSSLLLGLFRDLNSSLHIADEKLLEESVLVAPVERVAEVVFPYLEDAKEAILESDSFELKNDDNDSNTTEGKQI